MWASSLPVKNWSLLHIHVSGSWESFSLRLLAICLGQPHVICSFLFKSVDVSAFWVRLATAASLRAESFRDQCMQAIRSLTVFLGCDLAICSLRRLLKAIGEARYKRQCENWCGKHLDRANILAPRGLAMNSLSEVCVATAESTEGLRFTMVSRSMRAREVEAAGLTPKRLDCACYAGTRHARSSMAQ